MGHNSFHITDAISIATPALTDLIFISEKRLSDLARVLNLTILHNTQHIL